VSNPLDDLQPLGFDWKDDDCIMSGDTITINSTDLSTMLGPITNSHMSASGTVTGTVTVPSYVSIGASSTTTATLSSNYNVGIGAVGSNAGWNGTFTNMEAKLQIDVEDEQVIFKTKEHTVNWDRLVEDIYAIKRAFMTMSNNEELMNKYPEIRDMLAEWMLRELK
jgi:hypothetical protein